VKQEEMKELLEKYGQEHVLKFYDRLNEEGKEKVMHQIETINFEECMKLYELTKEKKEFKNVKLEPLKATVAAELSFEEIKKISFKGEKTIREVSLLWL